MKNNSKAVKNLSKILKTTGNEGKIFTYSVVAGADPISTAVFHGHRIYKKTRAPFKKLVTSLQQGLINPLAGRRY